jgi:hypothetical protein
MTETVCSYGRATKAVMVTGNRTGLVPISRLPGTVPACGEPPVVVVPDSLGVLVERHPERPPTGLMLVVYPSRRR